MPIKITKIVFDIFGVVLSSGFATAANELSVALNRPIVQIKPIYEHWEIPFDLGKITQNEFWDQIQNKLKTEVAWRKLNSIVMDNYTVNHEAVELLKYCERNSDVFFLSNTRKEWFEELDRIYFLKNMVKKTYLSYEMKLKKPQIECFEYVLEDIAARPNEVLFIDDKVENTNQASSLGVNSLEFRNAMYVKRKIQQHFYLQNKEF